MTDLVTRLIAGCKIKDPSDCWEWQKYTSPTGYGVIAVGGRAGTKERAHRISYQLFVGDIPEGEVVRHKCDNRCCVNPRHLELGSQRDNVRDMCERGRLSYNKAKLSPDDVVSIRERVALGADAAELAKHYDVQERTIRRIIERETWDDAESRTWRVACSIEDESGIPF